MTPRLFVRDDAVADLEEATDWYEARRPGLGGEFLRAVRALFASVAREPGQYPIARSPVRRARVRRFPYVVYFVAEPDSVVVLAVFHGRRDPRVWQSRA